MQTELYFWMKRIAPGEVMKTNRVKQKGTEGIATQKNDGGLGDFKHGRKDRGLGSVIGDRARHLG